MRKAYGFTLIEIVVVLAIVSLLLAMAAFATRAITIQQRISTTATRLATVDAALIQFVMVQKRLPCPAEGSVPSGGVDSNSQPAGTEVPRNPAVGCTATQAYGVVPWRTLGITENDMTDGWVRRLTYRVDPSLAGDGAMDMSACDPAGSNTTTGGALRLCQPYPATCNSTNIISCTTPLNFLTGAPGTNKGLLVRSISGARLMDPAAPNPTGAAYILISHGESGGGALLNTGVMATSTTVDGTEEQKNYANLPLGVYYVDDSVSDIAGGSHFDDMLSHPTILTVINKAALGPRSH